ncbi:ATP-dependent DNA helicase RecG [Lachnospiraceae bacterium XBB1006]|nr:ATP-dependent DNA helicase RecG [Lachnospiraceae bacterium XBB1006]
MDLYSSVKELKGVGAKTQELLAKIGVYTIRDILLHFPYNYVLYPAPVSISEYEEDTTVALRGRLAGKPYLKGGRMQTITARITDGDVTLPVYWYHMPYLRATLHVGEDYIFYGKVHNKNGQFVMEQPVLFTEEAYAKKRTSLQPVYHLTDGLTNTTFLKLVSQSVQFAEQMKENLSSEIRTRRNLVSYKEAIVGAHFPHTTEELFAARNRLAFDEFFQFLLKLTLLKEERSKTTCSMMTPERIITVSKQLPFTLTQGQQQALTDILGDMQRDVPMQRLLQGDVGSGKTIVAFLAMLFASQNGYQSALMAPTEVLAMQHYEKLQAFCQEHAPFTNVYLLTGSITATNKRKIKQALSLDSSAMVVGTHALLVDDVQLPNLGLVITDEQHRFGVHQRQILTEKGSLPHILVMSATPIPRTLAIILYGDLDVSMITSRPKNRLPIKNCVVKQSYRKTAYEFIRKQVASGHQAYVICPLVEETEGMDGVDVISYTAHLKSYYEDAQIPLRVECLHGKMRPSQKNDIMKRFANKEIDILVSTTVIEVGVDVPNATVMMVENAERFGLAQLHQLRGRVGRGSSQSYCIFIDGKRGGKVNPRLEILNKSNDGFYIAEEDLKLRGPGDIFGIRQSGELDFQIADIYHDASLLKDASWEASNILKEDPFLQKEEHQALRGMLNI